VSVPPPLEVGPKPDAEMRRGNRKLPKPMRSERMYQNPQFRYDFLAWEHTARCWSTFHCENQLWDAPDEEDDDDYNIIKEEADEAIEDAALSSTSNLPLEYLIVLAAGYDKYALLQQVLETSKANRSTRSPTSRVLLPSPEWWRSICPLCHLHHHYHCTRSRWRIMTGRRCRLRPASRSPSRRSSSTFSPTTRSSGPRHNRCPYRTAS
jgi:hypothetical protein